MIYADSDVAKAVGEDPQSAPIPELHKALFRWMKMFVHNSWQSSGPTIDELRTLGASDRDLADWLQIASTQVWFTSSADAAGIALEGNAVTGPVMQHPREYYHQHTRQPHAKNSAPKPQPNKHKPHAWGWLAAPCEGEPYRAAAVAAERRYGAVPLLFRGLSACPDFYRRHQLALDLLEGPQSGTLSPRLHALVRAASVALNHCSYFEPTVQALLNRHLHGEVSFEQLRHDREVVGCNEQERLLLAFTDKLINCPYKITAQDAQNFRSAGLDDAAYVDVFNTVAIQTSLDRLANCLGVQADSMLLLRMNG